MAEVKWTARRVTDGVLVDVTGDTENSPAPAPTQNALDSGDGVTEEDDVYSFHVGPPGPEMGGVDLQGALVGGDMAGSVTVTTTGAEVGQIRADDGDLGTGAILETRGVLNLFTVAAIKAIEAWDADGNVLRFALLPVGQIMTGVTAAPADGVLSAGQLAFWFDSTNGAGKLMIKAKTANGTVVTGNVALT